MGKIYGKKKDYEKAFESFRIAAMYAPGDSELRSNLALAYSKIGDYEHAIRQYNAIVRHAPKDPQGYFLLAKAYAEGGQFKEALEQLRKAFEMDKHATKDVLEIGDVVFNKKQYDIAGQIYEIALKGEKDRVKAYNKIGLCYKVLGLPDKAREAFTKGLAIEKDNKELKDSLKGL